MFLVVVGVCRCLLEFERVMNVEELLCVVMSECISYVESVVILRVE